MLNSLKFILLNLSYGYATDPINLKIQGEFNWDWPMDNVSIRHKSHFGSG